MELLQALNMTPADYSSSLFNVVSFTHMHGRWEDLPMQWQHQYYHKTTLYVCVEKCIVIMVGRVNTDCGW